MNDDDRVPIDPNPHDPTAWVTSETLSIDEYRHWLEHDTLVEEAAALVPHYDLGDAPTHIRFYPRHDQELFVADGYISDRAVLVPVARLTKPQKAIADLVSQGDCGYVACGREWVAGIEMRSLAEIRAGLERLTLTATILKMRLAEKSEMLPPRGCIPKRLMRMLGSDGTVYVCDASYIAPLITMGGSGSLAIIRGERVVIVRDRDGGFVGLAGLWIQVDHSGLPAGMKLLNRGY